MFVCVLAVYASECVCAGDTPPGGHIFGLCVCVPAHTLRVSCACTLCTGDLPTSTGVFGNNMGRLAQTLDLQHSAPGVSAAIIAMTKVLMSATDIDGIRIDAADNINVAFL